MMVIRPESSFEAITLQQENLAAVQKLKCGCFVLEILSPPLIKHRQVDLVLVAQIRNCFAFNQTVAKNGSLCSGAKEFNGIFSV